MSRFELLSSLTTMYMKQSHWKRYVGDTFLVLSGISLLTGIIAFFHLSVKIPDSLSLYLLFVMALAALRGYYSALLAAFLSFFVFDFLFVPPLYNLIITKLGDFLTLFVFLTTAIITSQLTSALRHYAAQASRRERETRILYNLVRATNREEDMERQLSIFVQSVVEVFSPLGVCACTLLLAGACGEFVLQVYASSTEGQQALSPAELEQARQVLVLAQTADYTPRETTQLLRFFPLKMDQKVLGVLCVQLDRSTTSSTLVQNLSVENSLASPPAVFFRMFLEHAVAVIERGHLRKERLRIQVLQQTDTLRAALLSSVSHDLHTPLAAIITAATSLQQKEPALDEEAQQSLAVVVEHEARRLNRLVENLLDMSRIEGGALCPEKVWYPAEELVRDVLGRMHPLLRARPLHLWLPEDLPAVELDYMQIDQVMTNLIENVLRYTPAGSPLDVSLRVQDASIRIEVADRGPGIPEVERERIFDKFYRVQGRQYAPAQPRGSGLGLAVCRGLVEAHGGHIWVESREGGGAVFCVTLPLSLLEENER